jgi:4-hydroxyphenylacetate 3-monooxygenase
MPVRTGLEYLRGLREQRRDMRICGERVKDVTTHPAFRNGARSVAALYDMQHDPALQEDMTYPSPTTGDRVGLSFISPQNLRDLEHRHTMMTHWAQASCGMMARTPDFLNVAFMAMAAAGDYFGVNRPEFKANIQHYYEFLREGDVTLTHTLVNPQRTRSPSLTDRLQEDVACSAFGGRQVLYERFFGGDPVRNAMILYNLYDHKPLIERVLDFLQRDE